MSVTEIKNKERVINELTSFIRKVLVEPEICETALNIAREHLNDENPEVVIADALSATTNIKIPVEHSEADRLFLEVLIDVIKDEKALY
ncbi:MULTISPECIES: hypothetical protein [unclassified Neptuniibacter]|uniref:hypothetical protein n=1 Tax=unclassified Neptuniibacter TaxID=2630693 RepID=UPI000C54851C|nr:MULTISPECIES: hypothetical protein [unclassified Neptuniibacter]MAY40741.1 hypothetical protein [Oceanospirillaceae bacterium]|tara:strand:- start:2741 stop:3007 length:267 start_codon:yes stop_codon:yes gene_type:complete